LRRLLQEVCCPQMGKALRSLAGHLQIAHHLNGTRRWPI
jgi:hypothetical protein